MGKGNMKTEAVKALLEKSYFEYNKLIDLLTKEGFEITSLTEEGDTILQVLFQCNLKHKFVNELVAALLKLKLDVNHANAKNETGFDLLLKAMPWDSDKITEELLLKGLDVNHIDSEGNTYLHIIAKNFTSDSNKIALILVQNNIRPIYLDSLPFNKEGDNFLHVLFRKKEGSDVLELVAALEKRKPDIKKLNINQRNKQGDTCFDVLFKNISYEGPAITEKLLALGLEVGCKDSEGKTYLHKLIQSLDRREALMAALIIKAMPDPLMPNNDGDSILHLLFKRSSANNYYVSDILKALENKKIDINCINRNQETCCDILLNNICSNSDEIFHKLIKLGLDVDRKDASGNSYLHKIPLKVNYSFSEVAAILIDAMKDPFSKNTAGKTPLEIWLEYSCKLAITHCYDGNINTIINSFVVKANKVGIEVIFDIIKNPHVDPDVKRRLLESKGHDFSIKDKDGHNLFYVVLDFLLLDEKHLYTTMKDFFKRCSSQNVDLYEKDKEGKIFLFKILQSNLDVFAKNIILNNFFSVFKFDFSRKIDGKPIFEGIDMSAVLPDSLLDALCKDVKLFSDNAFLCKFKHYCKKEKSYEKIYLMFSALSNDPKMIDERMKAVEDEFFNHYESSEELDTRMLGHRFSLKGSLTYIAVDQKEMREVVLTGMSHQRSVPVFYSALHAFTSQIDIQSSPALKNRFAAITDIVRKSLRYFNLTQRFNSLEEKTKNEIFEQWLNDCKQDISIIYTGYPGHAISIVISGGTTLYRCNRGGCSNINDIVEQYTITNPKVLTVEVLKKIILEDDRETNKVYIQNELHSLLGLKLINIIKGKSQSVGNCGWASKKAGLRALIHASLSRNLNLKSKAELEAVLKSDYKKWSSFDKTAFFDYYLKKYAQHSVLPAVLRRMLCTHYDPKNEKDMALGTKVITILKSLPRFEESYTEFLIYHWALGLANKKKEQEQFILFLKNFNIDLLNLEWSSSQIPKQVKLFQALINQDNKWVDELLKTCHEEEMTYMGWNPLHITAGNNNLALVESLCSRYPKWANMQNPFKENPLMFAANEMIADKLLLAGAAINIGEDGGTPLNKAIKCLNLKLVKFLMEKGAIPNDYSLYTAAETGNVAIAKLIVENSSYAEKEKQDCLPEVLQKNKDKILNSKTYSYKQAIHAASSNGHVEMLQYLVSLGADINVSDVNGDLPLHVAVRNNRDNVVVDIVRRPGVKIKASNHQNKIAFDLIDEKTAAEAKQKNEASADHLSVALYQFQAFAKQPKLDFMNSLKQHFFCAIRAGDKTVAAACLKFDPKLDINDNVSPFSHNPLHEAILNDGKIMFDFLMTLPNIDVNAAAESNEGPIHFAIIKQDMYKLTMLLKHPNIKINVKGDFDDTPLHEAVTRKNEAAAIALLERPEIDLTIRNKRGQLAKDLKFDILESEESRDAHARIVKLIRDREKGMLTEGALANARLAAVPSDHKQVNDSRSPSYDNKLVKENIEQTKTVAEPVARTSIAKTITKLKTTCNAESKLALFNFLQNTLESEMQSISQIYGSMCENLMYELKVKFKKGKKYEDKGPTFYRRIQETRNDLTTRYNKLSCSPYNPSQSNLETLENLRNDIMEYLEEVFQNAESAIKNQAVFQAIFPKNTMKYEKMRSEMETNPSQSRTAKEIFLIGCYKPAGKGTLLQDFANAPMSMCNKVLLSSIFKFL